MRKRLVWLCFAIYGLALCLLLFHRVPYRTPGWNIRPFSSIRGYLKILSQRDPHAPYFRYACINLVGNGLLLLPLGVFFPVLFIRQRRFLRFLLTVLVLTLAIESLQHVTAVGVLDVDDLLLNVLGAVLGYWLWRISQKRIK